VISVARAGDQVITRLRVQTGAVRRAVLLQTHAGNVGARPERHLAVAVLADKRVHAVRIDGEVLAQ
jgi:hypothetical protein